LNNKVAIGSNIKMQKSQNNDISSLSSIPAAKTKGYQFRSWFIGILLLAGVIAAVTHIGEIEHFAKLAREAKPKWLLVALLLQFGTYICTAAVWKRALHYVNIQQSFLSFVPLALAKLFADQVLPSGGASGISFFIAALKRRGACPAGTYRPLYGHDVSKSCSILRSLPDCSVSKFGSAVVLPRHSHLASFAGRIVLHSAGGSPCQCIIVAALQ
jgi:hypothetical protein